MLKSDDLTPYQQAIIKAKQSSITAQEDTLYTHQTYGTVLNQASVDAAVQVLLRNNTYYTGSRQGKSISQLLMQQWTGTLPSKRAKGVRDAPHIGITVNGETLHLTAYNTQLGVYGLIPKMKVKAAPKWLTDKVAVLRIMEPRHDWVGGIGQRTSEDCFTVLCPYKYAPRKRRQPEVKR